MSRKKSILGLATAAGTIVVAAAAVGGQYAKGSICRYEYGAAINVFYDAYGINNGTNSSINVVCPVPVDHGVGVIQWQMDVIQTIRPAQVLCRGTTWTDAIMPDHVPVIVHSTGYVWDHNGNGTIVPPAGPQSAAGYYYQATCQLPPQHVVPATGHAITAGVAAIKVF